MGDYVGDYGTIGLVYPMYASNELADWCDLDGTLDNAHICHVIDTPRDEAE